MARDVSSNDGAAGVQTKSRKPSPKHDDGAVCVRWVRCGRRWCRCMNGGPKHGPYYARYWWQGGRRYKAYVRSNDAPEAFAACADRRWAERVDRSVAGASRQEWRHLLTLIREIEHGGH